MINGRWQISSLFFSRDQTGAISKQVSTPSCGKVCGQFANRVSKRLIYLDFQQNAHKSGALLTSSQRRVCMHETEFPTSKLESRLKGRTTSDQVNRSEPKSSSFSISRLGSLIVLLLTLQVSSCVKLPRRTIATQGTTSSTVSSNAKPEATRLNLNTASANDLQALPGVGPVLAERIVAHREQYGPFRLAEHLMMVRGFSDHKFRAIRNLVTVE
jgi:competence ComEA-like helix-hairpin-helix protein